MAGPGGGPGNGVCRPVNRLFRLAPPVSATLLADANWLRRLGPTLSGRYASVETGGQAKEPASPAWRTSPSGDEESSHLFRRHHTFGCVIVAVDGAVRVCPAVWRECLCGSCVWNLESLCSKRIKRIPKVHSAERYILATCFQAQYSGPTDCICGLPTKAVGFSQAAQPICVASSTAGYRRSQPKKSIERRRLHLIDGVI